MVEPLTIVVPGRPPTPNARRHWRQVAADNLTWKSFAYIAAKANMPADWLPLASADVRVTFVLSDRRSRDLDNLIASTKPLTDGLVQAGVIADDSLDVIRHIEYGWRHQKGVDATEYVVWDAL